MNSPIAWALVFHVFGIVFWIGGLLIVTQVLAMHASEDSLEGRRAFERLEVKLLRGAAHPGAAITIVAGIAVVASQPNFLQQGWLHIKLLLVAVMIALDVLVYLRARQLNMGVPVKRGHFMLLHGAISLVFLGILVLVMIKPF